MFKITFAAIALLSTTACMGTSSQTVSTKMTSLVDGCPHYTGVSREYSRTAPGLPVRCGPQSELPVTYLD